MELKGDIIIFRKLVIEDTYGRLVILKELYSVENQATNILTGKTVTIPNVYLI